MYENHLNLLNIKINNIIRTVSENILLCADCNGHHSAWFNEKNNKEGVLFNDFIISNNFMLHNNNNNNKSDEYTFQGASTKKKKLEQQFKAKAKIHLLTVTRLVVRAINLCF